jgi:hypothetical protein
MRLQYKDVFENNSKSSKLYLHLLSIGVLLICNPSKIKCILPLR